MNVKLSKYASIGDSAYRVEDSVVCRFMNAMVEVRHTDAGLVVVATPYFGFPPVTVTVEDPNMRSQVNAAIAKKKGGSRGKRVRKVSGG